MVGIYRSGGYEVEFTGPEGETMAVVALDEEDIRRRKAHEIPHATGGGRGGLINSLDSERRR